MYFYGFSSLERVMQGIRSAAAVSPSISTGINLLLRSRLSSNHLCRALLGDRFLLRPRRWALLSRDSLFSTCSVPILQLFSLVYRHLALLLSFLAQRVLLYVVDPIWEYFGFVCSSSCRSACFSSAPTLISCAIIQIFAISYPLLLNSVLDN